MRRSLYPGLVGVSGAAVGIAGRPLPCCEPVEGRPTVDIRRMVLLLGICASWAPSLKADEGIDFFESRIRPVLVQHCYECHSAATADLQGAFRLDSRDGIRAGGETGPAVVPGNTAESLLLEAIRHESLKMPPDTKLSEPVIEDFVRWIEMGAPDPRDHAPTLAEAAELSWEATLAARRDWWSLKPVRQPDIPDLRNADWSDLPIDRFILRRLQDAALSPGEAAEPRTLIRRLSLVLLGLPPTPEDVERFVEEYAAAAGIAYEKRVETMLSSPHFGERWARHWMDVVRFTETHGNEWNYEVHHAWRYRDYLIRAFNQDIPFDELIREHIAGDLLPDPRWNAEEQFNESVIGTAFYRFGEVNHDDCIGLPSIGYDLLDNQLDTLTKAFQATTAACARCHDHKIDAVSTKDYYALLGILRSSRLVAHTIDAPDVNAEPIRQLRALKAEIHAQLAPFWAKDAENTARYLLAADAQRRNRPDAAALGGGLDSDRLEHWVRALGVETDEAKGEQPTPLEDPLSPWKTAASVTRKSPDGELAAAWNALSARYTAEQESRRQFNESQFLPYADFRHGDAGDWSVTGQGLRQGATASGELCVATEGDAVIGAVLPAGAFTHTVSQRLNGALRSPILHTNHKSIIFEVMGEKTSAVRLVTNNCQLNYRNYRALTGDALEWVTFELPDQLDSRRVYAELMTKFDNPKFPDQLGTLGKDKQNDRIPWNEAAADPRSYFGVTRVVLHDGNETPQPDLGHLVRLFESAEPAPHTLADVAEAYSRVVRNAIRAWAEGRATDEDAKWLQWLLSRKLLTNSVRKSPELSDLVAAYRTIETHRLAQPRIVPGIAETGDGFNQFVLVRGDCEQRGDVVERRYLEVLAQPSDNPIRHGSGRLELAERIASPDNPLTARVMVNRVWHHLFGAGIVKSVDDFGRVGDQPSHPELLDYLAVRLVAEDWSLKQLIREIVLSQTFRLSSRSSVMAQSIDPQNRLLSHYPARRIDAESIRDALLAASGRLDRTQFGMSVFPFREEANTYRRLFPGPLDGDGRRSVYLKVSLMEGAKFLEAFNFPGCKVAQGRRDVTNVPTQALTLLNDPFVLQQAAYWADQLIEQPHHSPRARIDVMFRTALGRPPTDGEAREFDGMIQRVAELHAVPAENIMTAGALWRDLSHVMFNLAEFIYVP
ncbi:MAG: PSD1 and planctomycete cytochrome C domain-containing protein [Planctomycetaceae bacterium]